MYGCGQGPAVRTAVDIHFGSPRLLISMSSPAIFDSSSVNIARQYMTQLLNLNVVLLTCRLVKAGLLDKKYAKRFSTISAWAELIGYVGNVTLNGLRIAAALERELMLTQELVRRKKVSQSCRSLHCLSVAWLLIMLLSKPPVCCSAYFKEDTTMSCQWRTLCITFACRALNARVDLHGSVPQL
jgi:hypothetical protein